MKLCSTCSGMRFVIKQEPRIWHQNGVSCVMGNLTTGISHVCDDCQGTGLDLDPRHDPDCPQCQGTGERNAWASSAEWETEDCTCSATVARANIVELVYPNRGKAA